MIRISRKIDKLLTSWALAIGIPTFAIYWSGETVGWLWIVIIMVSIVGLCLWYLVSKSAKRRAKLMAKYKDESLVKKLMSKSFWQGQTAEQLLDSLGKPKGIDERILKTKKRKYGSTIIAVEIVSVSESFWKMIL